MCPSINVPSLCDYTINCSLLIIVVTIGVNGDLDVLMIDPEPHYLRYFIGGDPYNNKDSLSN